MNGDGMAYIAIAPCGCCSGILATGYGSPKEDAKDVQGWIARGDVVKHMTADQAREEMNRRGVSCPHDPRFGRQPSGIPAGQERMAV